MIKVALFCNGGASTGILVSSIKKAAKEQKIDLDIAAYADITIQEKIQNIDIALLGPQISFKKSKYQTEYPDKIIEAINPMDYGMMNGKNVLDQILKLYDS